MRKMIEWKSIKDFDNYEISTDGRVRSLITNKILKPFCGTSGCRVMLTKDNKKYTKYINRLVAETFIENPKKRSYVNNINGDKRNNDVNNLEWSSFRGKRIQTKWISLFSVETIKYL